MSSFGETKTHVIIRRNPQEHSVELNIGPAISNYEQHVQRRIAASVMFEMAAKIAEKVDGEIIHLANVIGCRAGSEMQRPLASYPRAPLLYENLCPGFREIFASQ